jgi:hypothetical protein
MVLNTGCTVFRDATVLMNNTELQQPESVLAQFGAIVKAATMPE